MHKYMFIYIVHVYDVELHGTIIIQTTDFINKSCDMFKSNVYSVIVNTCTCILSVTSICMYMYMCSCMYTHAVWSLNVYSSNMYRWSLIMTSALIVQLLSVLGRVLMVLSEVCVHVHSLCCTLYMLVCGVVIFNYIYFINNC